MKNDISEESYQKLKKFLEKQFGRPVILEEAKDIGDKLVDFYKMLKSIQPKAGAAALSATLSYSQDELETSNPSRTVTVVPGT